MSGGAVDPAALKWIAVDWGTSSVRAFAMGEGDRVLGVARSDRGMGTLAPEDYEDALLELAGDWLPVSPAAPIPTLVCGMAGAKGGWAEAGYRAVPCAPLCAEGLAAPALRDRRLSVRIAPGLRQDAPADVMRGEETQIAGLLARREAAGQGAPLTLCLPGTHSKWARIEDGRVARFATCMTGEIFAALASATILRASVGAGDADPAAFAAGVEEMLEDPARLTAALFGIRAAALLQGADGAAGRGRLSGLLIGAELAAMRAQWREGPVTVIGAGGLAARYAEALRLAGADVTAEDGDALALAGLARLREMLAQA